MNILLALLALSLVIVIHEFGHFIIARLCGVTCYTFSLGMGPRLFGFRYRNTDFRISMFLIGGYVHIKGFNDINTYDPDSYLAKHRWQKLSILAAGPGANFISVFIGAVLTFSLYGVPAPSNIVSQVTFQNNPGLMENSSLKPGDTIVSINGNPTSDGKVLLDTLNSLPKDKSKSFVIMRDNEKHVLDFEPGNNSITFSLAVKEERLDLSESTKKSSNLMASAVKAQIDVFRDVANRKSGIMEQLSGPVGIVNIGAQLNNALGRIEGTAIFIFFVSIAVGFINLLPIPVLDGGHITITVIEMAIRRDLGLTLKRILMAIGFVILLALFIFVTLNDLSRLFGT